MADTAFQVQYRQQFIDGFENGVSLLRACVTTEAVIKGNSAVFLVADTNGATAVTRGVNGLIPARADNLNQITATLVEYHDLVRKTSFNIFAGQGDQTRIMQAGVMKVINREIDRNLIAQLDTATQDTGGATTASVNLVMKAQTILGNADVPVEDENNMFAVITPAFRAYLMQTSEFSNGDYVEVKPFNGPARKMWRWSGINWIVNSEITGKGTAAEKCYMFHRSALGHAVDKSGIQSPVGYDAEQDYSWARCSIFMGSKVLQNTGIVQMLHDGSAYVAT